ncbi:BREX system ATP-binding domain-containing protein [Neoroseomonas oryzicola]|nr:BREX system ATP-binding domain-containing protein [Neoroseomonas oryzicola]
MHYDDDIEARIEAFMADHRTRVVIIEGTQGTGKTNLLNHYASEIRSAIEDDMGFYVVRYLADPEASFDGTIRRLLHELGPEHLQVLGQKLAQTGNGAIESARSVEVRTALYNLSADPTLDVARSFLEWLLGMRLLNAHRNSLGVGFRLDTIEARTAALRDLVTVSAEVGLLNGIFLLLDELEKQDGVLSPTAVVRYLSALRAIIDALPSHLFMMLAMTPDAMRRYSVSLPAFRSRLQDRVELTPLQTEDESVALGRFYLDQARDAARRIRGPLPKGVQPIVTEAEMRSSFQRLLPAAQRLSDTGVRQRRFLHDLFEMAERRIYESEV